jgi:predicted alpha/beta hydrolase family esterase
LASHWQRSLPNSARVEQPDWLTPQRRDWVQALEQAIAAESSPVILIAHSLGCITVAHWAAQASPNLLRRVRGALLVAPADVERPNCAPACATLRRSRCRRCRSQPGGQLGQRPGRERATGAGPGAPGAPRRGCWHAGHINVKSGHERWEQGFAYLYRLQAGRPARLRRA